MTPRLSVVIPCYNMGQYVKDTIASVLAYPKQEEVELIVINDGSDDDGYTRTVLDTYTQAHVHIVHQENKGLGAARNAGVALAKAPYVLLLDADNAIRPCYISEGIAVLDAQPHVGLVYGDLERFGIEQGKVEVGSFDISKLLYKNYIDACVVLRKSAWESVGGYDSKMPVMGYEDWDINMRLFFKGWQFYYLNTVCFDYRVREHSMLANSNDNKELLIDYMFNKPELTQAKYLRRAVLDASFYKEELKQLKKRKVIHAALKIEKPIKSIYKNIKK